MSKPHITLHHGDIPADLELGNLVAIDTESLGLRWARDRLCLVQLSSGDGTAHLVKFEAGKYDAPNLKKMLIDPGVTKLFHFARADLATLKYHLGVMTAPVYCTKIASIIARTFSDRHSLKDLARDVLGLDLAKEQQTSDWGTPELTDAQKSYAASDVLYLHKIKSKLDEMLVRDGRAELAQAVLDFLPTRAELDLCGWNDVDVFAHKPFNSSSK
ncbi:MAG: ribonuclease D [Alphaproteobacteria bacterium]|nr:ribonuclease D [Alphaproteobacteria bacterium]